MLISEVPRELIQQARGGEVNLNLEDHRQEDYVKPRTAVRAFTGEGHRLGWYALAVLLFIYFTLFLQRVSIACYAERCISYSKSVRPSVCPSVCLSVRHTLALSQNDSSYDHGVFIGG